MERGGGGWNFDTCRLIQRVWKFAGNGWLVFDMVWNEKFQWALTVCGKFVLRVDNYEVLFAVRGKERAERCNGEILLYN